MRGSRRSLDGVPVLLTGASSGIGEATAAALAERGTRPAIAARRRTNLEEAADRIAEAGGIRPVVLEADLARQGAAAELARRRPLVVPGPRAFPDSPSRQTQRFTRTVIEAWRPTVPLPVASSV